MHRSRCVKRTLRTQTGFILLPVVLAIVLIATIAFLLNNQSAINVDSAAGEAQARQADAIAAAGLAHATWGAQNSGCAGDMATTTVPFGQTATGSYTATVTTPGGATSAYPNLAADQDAWFRSDNITNNNGGQPTLHLRRELGNLEYAVVRFDLSSLPAGAQINSAMARFYVDGGKGHPEGPVTVHRATADWLENSATWETMATNFDSAVLATIPAQPDAGAVWVEVNLTAQVQAWVNGGEPNYGVMLIPTGEGTHAEYMSRDGGATTRPLLNVIVGTGPASPATITATGTLTGNTSPANDITRTLTRDAVPAWQPPGARVLQPGTEGTDTYIYEWKPGWNYGASNTIWVENRFANSIANGLLRFDLAGVPAGARVTSAVLALYQTDNSLNGGPVGVHRVTSTWVEGTSNGANGSPNWTQRAAGSAWTSAGGDYDAAAFTITTVPAGTGWSTWDITGLVNGWVSGAFANQGLALVAGTFGTASHFASSDATDPTLHPKLTITYACECGSPCLAPQGAGKVMMVVVDPTTLVPADAYKKALFESWGYTVNVMGENANASAFLSEATLNDVFFISESVNVTQVGNRIKDVPIGVVSQDGAYNSQLGFATGSAWPVGSSINVTDTSHYITAPFPTGPLDIYTAGMEQLTVAGTPAPGLQTLADSGGAGSLVVLDKGATMTGGGTAAGRRVMLPLGRDTKFNWDYLNSNGRLLVQRALQWGTGNTGEAPAKTLLFVSGGTTMVQFPSGDLLVIPTAQEQLRIDLIESWGYGVNLIADDDSQANFDTAVAAADVAYIAESVVLAQLGKKLKAATVGVVNEDPALHDVFGFSTVRYLSTTNPPMNTNAAHYITAPFGGATVLALFSSNQPLGAAVGTLPSGLDTIGIWAGGTMSSLGGLLTLDTGAAISAGETAPGRRVQLPWGGQDGVSVVDINALTADGLTIMRRSIEWAGGAGCGTTKPLLMLVGDAANPTAEELSRKTLLESWCYSVSTITASVPQATYDTFADIYDVVYVPSSVNYADVTSKLKLQPVGVVNEVGTLSAYLGFTSGTSGYTGTVTELTDNTHYITSGLTLGNLAITTISTSLRTFVNTMGPGLHTLSTRPSSTNAMIMTLETGDELLWGGNAPDRRVMLPWGGSSTFDPDNLTADGLTILQRALEWAAGVGGGGGGGPPAGGGPVFEEFTEAQVGGKSSSMTINKPAGTTMGDLLIAAVVTDGNNASSLAAPAGWNVVNVATSSGNVTVGVWWKLATASEGSSYTFDWSNKIKAYGWIMRFSGHDPVTPVNTAANASGASAVPPSPSVTTTLDNTLILRLGGFAGNAITVGAPGLAGHTAINMNYSNTGGNAASGGSGYVLQPVAGASGTSSFALTGSNSYVTVTLAIAPAP